MFESWLEQEKATIKSLYGNARTLCIFLGLLMVPFFLLNLIMLLDGGGASSLVACAFSILVIIVIFSMGNYKRRFVKPLLTSIQQELPSEESRQEFAQQMQKPAARISYQPQPQTKACDIMAAESYCYMRQPGKSRIFRNSQIRSAMLTQEHYNTGYRGHLRLAYALALYTADSEQTPIWKGYFKSDSELYQAFALLKPLLPQDMAVLDNVALGKTGAGRKTPLWANILYICFIIAILVLAWARHTGRLG